MPALLLAWTAASADDRKITTKRLTGGSTDNKLTVLPEDVLEDVSHAEHAITDMMKFYVPAQLASGDLVDPDPGDNVELGVYRNIDGEIVEEIMVAKPLVSVSLYGPAIEVPDTAFAHSFMDVFAAVSLDDGLTSKKTNLSESANESSFTLGVDGGGDGHSADIPADHTEIERNEGLFAFHAPGMDEPYTYCADCHGATLEGGHHREPSCYSCHGIEWEEEPDEILVVYIEEAYAKVESSVKVKLKVEGEVEGVDDKTNAELFNGVTGAHIATEKVEDEGEFEFELKLYGESAPCTVMVEVEGVESAVVPVIDKNTNEPIENCEGEVYDLAVYPGGAYNVFHATAANKVLVAWPSRYCRQGQPAYSFAYDGDDENMDPALVEKREALEAYLGIDVDAELNADLYLTDLFGVAGSQGSIDFAEEGYPQAGEVPHGCVWTARGVLLPGDDPRTEDAVESTYMIWTKPERLTSGRRDPNRIEVRGVQGAGFVITWQEDPDGLRPGQGLGPGEGWSGAVAHDKTDIWYSFIPWEHFDTVEMDDTANDADALPDPVNIAEYMLFYSDQGLRPKVYVPMAVPMRLTNNDKCQPDLFGPGGTIAETDPRYFSYCNFDVAAAYGLPDFCKDSVLVPVGQSGAEGEICVADTNYDDQADLPNLANTASTRPRLSLQGYDPDGDGVTDRAWVIVAAEESKGLGRYAFLPGGEPCEDLRADDPNYDPDCGADIGKNQWYFSFDMGEPQTSLTSGYPNGLVRNLVKQGNLLNQPEVDWRTGEYYPLINTSQMWDFGTYNYDLYNTEIARRASLLVQPIGKAVTSRYAGGSMNGPGLLAMPSWKQGAMRQGGPADTMLRRIVLPDNYAEGINNNPYAFTNMACASWLITAADANPYYPDGICGEPATNLSSVVPDTCKNDDTNGAIDCPTVDFTGSTFGQLVFPQSLGGPILQGYEQGEGDKTRVLTWHQCPSDGVAQDTSELEGEYFACGDTRTDPFVNLKDQSWYNPLDISKGHRGFIDGDFVMFLYAWSPNWRLNAKGNDRYDLYVRRSFDGGATWTTTPTSFTASNGDSYTGDGTVTCETYRSTVTQTPQAPEPHVCYTYPAGGHEQARNVTQHSRMNVTTLDPRYAPTPATIVTPCVDDADPTIDATVMTCDDGHLTGAVGDSDLRDPSRYFMVFETGDNKTVQAGEAEPWDLYYSRAESFGDDYVVWYETDTGYVLGDNGCYPTDSHEDADVIDSVLADSGFCNEFDRMNTRGDTFSSEANLEANPDGSKLYGVWAQWVFLDRDDYESPIIESDAMMRRIWWIDDYISDLYSWDLPGTNKPEQ